MNDKGGCTTASATLGLLEIVPQQEDSVLGFDWNLVNVKQDLFYEQYTAVE